MLTSIANMAKAFESGCVSWCSGSVAVLMALLVARKAPAWADGMWWPQKEAVQWQQSVFHAGYSCHGLEAWASNGQLCSFCTLTRLGSHGNELWIYGANLRRLAINDLPIFIIISRRLFFVVSKPIGSSKEQQPDPTLQRNGVKIWVFAEPQVQMVP